eukprot:422238-Pleurochrysis_carterae.AAC.1
MSWMPFPCALRATSSDSDAPKPCAEAIYGLYTKTANLYACPTGASTIFQECTSTQSWSGSFAKRFSEASRTAPEAVAAFATLAPDDRRDAPAETLRSVQGAACMPNF